MKEKCFSLKKIDEILESKEYLENSNYLYKYLEICEKEYKTELDKKAQIKKYNEFMENLKDPKEKIEDIIILLKELKWDIVIVNQGLLEDIIVNSDLNKIKIVYKYMDEIKIPKEYLINHIKILSDKYELFIRNATFIIKENIQINNYEILVEETEKLLKRYNLVNLYNINLRKLSNNNDDFLINDESFNYFDQYIELGYYSFIRNHLPYCKKENEDILKRAIIADSINMQIIEGKEFAKEIINEKSFVVEKERYEEYINDATKLQGNKEYLEKLKEADNIDCDINLEEIKDLDKNYYLSDYEYNFNGIIISRIKVIRNLTTLKKEYKEAKREDLIFNAIISNTKLTIDKIEEIESIIYNKKLLYI